MQGNCMRSHWSQSIAERALRSWWSECHACLRRAMQDECNALELELKHHEKGFAELVSEELEQRFMRFEEVTLAAVQKMVGIISASEAAPAGETGLPTSWSACGDGMPMRAYALRAGVWATSSHG